eukprot:m.479176 g.479176  ORF g.479176 m.479176 type:complete len:128 (-) comp21352_c0_seq1:586-969(-)
MDLNPQFAEIAQAFVPQYYTTFDTNRPMLAQFYQPDSMMTFEGDSKQGPAIMEKVMALPFQVVQHIVTTIDAQPCHGGMIVVFVVGQLKTDDDPAHAFSQTFVLKPTPAGSFYVFNDMFRLSIHNVA